MASSTADLVMALNTTRSMATSFKARRFSSTSMRCHEIASPSRSGSVARISLSAPFTASAMAFTCFCDLVSTSQVMAKSASGSTDPFFDGRSRTCPKLAST